MEKTKRIYPSTQLIVALDAKVLKVYLWILSWSASQGSVKYYAKQFAKACKLEEYEVERCIQSLEDAKLIDISRVDQTWMITPNAEQNHKYYNVPISKVLEGKGIMMADNVTWNVEKVTWNVVEDKPKREMSTEQMKKMIMMLQAQLQEKEEVEKMVVNSPVEANIDIDSLPF